MNLLPATTEAKLKVSEFTRVYSDELDLQGAQFNPQYDLNEIWNIVFAVLNVFTCGAPYFICKCRPAKLEGNVFRDFLCKFPQVQGFDLVNCDLTDFDLSHLENNAQIRTLMLGRASYGSFLTSQERTKTALEPYNLSAQLNDGTCKFQDAGIDSAATLQSLTHFYLDASATTGGALHSIALLPSLETLFVANPFTEVDQHGVRKSVDFSFLNEFTKLKHLYLMYGTLCNAQLLEIQKRGSLQTLGFSAQKEVRLRFLQGLPLRTLSVCHHGLTDEDVTHVGEFKELRKLCLLNCFDSETVLTRESLKVFKGMKKLESLIIGIGKNTLQFADYISTSHNLKHLALLQQSEDLDAEDYQYLRHLEKLEALAACAYKAHVMPKEFLENVCHLKRLKNLVVHGKLQDQDVDRLRGLKQLETLEVVVDEENDLVAFWSEPLEQLKALKSIRFNVSIEPKSINAAAQENAQESAQGNANPQPPLKDRGQILSQLRHQVELLKAQLEGVEITLVEKFEAYKPDQKTFQAFNFAYDLPDFFKSLRSSTP